MSQSKRGQCPVKFLWQGDKKTVALIYVGLALAVLAILVKIISLYFGLRHDFFREVLFSGVITWLVGKGLSFVVTRSAYSAQKRAKTSMKKIFTRTLT